MSQPTSLKQAVQAVNTSASPQDKITSLTYAFNLFSQETERLETAYAALKRQFQEVNLELEDANAQLSDKVSELDLLNSYLNSILTNMSQGILFINLNGIVSTYNHAAEGIVNISHSKVLFRTFWENFSDELFGFSMRSALSSREVLPMTFIALNRNKLADREVEVNTTFILNKGPYPSLSDPPRYASTQGLIVLLRDVTEERQWQRLANRNDRLKELGEMAAMVAHEIRNPLGGIKGFASLLERDLAAWPKWQQMASYIVAGTDSLNRLVTRVLNYARPVQLEITRIDLVALVDELKCHMQADESLGFSITWKVEAHDPHIWIYADGHQIKSCLMNLLVNAIQAMPQGGSLTIQLGQSESEAVIRVQDTGVGIAPEHLEHIFSPFFTTKAEGNGFGLAEVYKGVQAHGGTIDVQSTVGLGTCFTLKLPLTILKDKLCR